MLIISLFYKTGKTGLASFNLKINFFKSNRGVGFFIKFFSPIFAVQ